MTETTSIGNQHWYAQQRERIFSLAVTHWNSLANGTAGIINKCSQSKMCRWKFITMVVKKLFDLHTQCAANCCWAQQKLKKKEIQTKNELFTFIVRTFLQFCILKFTNYYITRWRRIQNNVDNKTVSECELMYVYNVYVHLCELPTVLSHQHFVQTTKRWKKKLVNLS